MAEPLVVDCSRPFEPADADRAETLTGIVSECVDALVEGDLEAATEKLATWGEVAMLPTVDDAIEGAPGAGSS